MHNQNRDNSVMGRNQGSRFNVLGDKEEEEEEPVRHEEYEEIQKEQEKDNKSAKTGWKTSKGNPLFAEAINKETDENEQVQGTDTMEIGSPVKEQQQSPKEKSESQLESQPEAMELGTPVKTKQKASKNESKGKECQAGSPDPNPKENPPDTSKKKAGIQRGLNVVKLNSKGASRKFLNAFKEMKRMYKPDMVCLFETRCSGIKAEAIIKKLGFNNYAINDARGYAGDIWALWNQDIDATCTYSHEQFLQLEIKDQIKGKWDVIAVYANPHAQIRDSIWPILESKCTNSSSLLMAGDFNEIASVSEQRGGSAPNLNRCNRFKEWINNCNLIDMVPAGPFFSWEGPKRQGQAKLYKRLDRTLCNQNWRNFFRDASPKCLARINSDHHPLLVLTEEYGTSAQNRPFRFENYWMNHDKFADIGKDEWDCINTPFNSEEIKRAVFSIGSSKAPGCDGFLASFYHQNWQLVADSLIKYL
ncbi:ribonuclease H [Senna tora]|uniref:Ribonuclease H n=1 Tax=Senna tora TaxID=362788 RepID=A0A834WQ62_9FABA|nr:ribonuclease H [Senna tora]